MVEAALSVAPFVDEFVLSECESSDETMDVLQRLAATNKKFRIERRPWPPDRSDGMAIGKAYTDAMSLCRGDYVWMVQADEVWWPDGCAGAVEAVRKNPNVDLLGFPQIHFVGMGHIRPQLHDRLKARVAKKSPKIYVVGDGCTLGGGSYLTCALPHPIHHYGWAFEGDLQARFINAASLWSDPKTAHQKARAEKAPISYEKKWLDTQEPYTGGHPPIMLPLVGLGRYQLRPELLKV